MLVEGIELGDESALGGVKDLHLLLVALGNADFHLLWRLG